MSNQNQTRERTAFERPADPFKALGNETRLEILRALYDQLQDASRDETIAYNELREAVGVRDKGNFNYHLRQLEGQFVDGEDGYRLTFAGFEIAKVIDVDAWRSHESLGPLVLTGDGRVNGTDRATERADSGYRDDEAEGDDEPELTATYEDSVVELRRGEDLLYAHAVRPAGAADRDSDLETLLDVASTLWRHTIEGILEGICPYCHARVERSLTPESEGYWRHSFAATCTNCGSLGGSHVGVAALSHPAVVSLFWDHGIDVTTRRFWTLPFVADDAVTVAREEPRRLRLDLECNEDRLAVFVDDDVRVVETERRDVAAGDSTA